MRALKHCLVFFAAIAPGAPLAAEVCVSCDGPAAVYRCEAEGFGPADRRATWACITELAKLEGHKSCTVDRRAEGPCDGPLKVVRRDLVGPGQGAPEAAEANAPAPETPGAPPEETSPTVAGALKKAGQSAGEQIENMGQAVGTGAQKAWKCVTTLWQDC